MPRSHHITCAHDDCPAWASFIDLKPTSPQQVAADHRAKLAASGWTDVEGRDYCPNHTPTGVAR